MASMDTIMEDEETSMEDEDTSMEVMEDDYEDSYLSSRDGIVFGTFDHSGLAGESLISGPNITSSSTSTDNHRQQRSNAAGGGCHHDLMMVSPSSSAASCSEFKNNIDHHRKVRIFNFDFRALSEVAVCNNVDEKENSIRLVKTMMDCVEAIQQKNVNQAVSLVKDLRILAVSQSGAKKKVATYFAEALDRRVHGKSPQFKSERGIDPYLIFANATANRAILEAFANSNRVHVIDLNFNQGSQWSSLMLALALRPGGPPALRITGVGNNDALWDIGRKLANFAAKIDLEFQFDGVVASSLGDVDTSALNVGPGNVEALAVNSVFGLHRLLSEQGEIGVAKLLNSIKEMQPKIVTIVEQESNYSTQPNSREEGTERLSQWRVRMSRAGFNPVQLGSNAYRQANKFLATFKSGNRYSLEESDECVTLTRNCCPFMAFSAWRPAAPKVIRLEL